jgi:signal peptidase I
VDEPGSPPARLGVERPAWREAQALAEQATAPATEAPSGRGRKVVIEWVVILAVAVLAAFLIRSFAIEPFFIPSGSMEPTLQVGDRVLVNKLSYDVHSVHRGDIVVFKKPANDFSPGVKDLIKRVVGLPGETISAHGGFVYIDGRELNEPWLPKGETTGSFPPVFVPKGDYFMMGDNRGDSADSRIIGPVSDKLFIGRAFVRVWPVSRIGGL